MNCFFDTIKSNFAHISIVTLLSVIIIIILYGTNTNIYIMIALFTILALYWALQVKHNRLEKKVNTIHLADPNYNKNQNQIALNSHYATIDNQFNITYFNQLFLKEHALENKSLLGKSLFKILDIDPKNVLKELKDKGNFNGIIESTHNNIRKYQSLTIQPTSNHSKKEYFIIYHDVTDSLKTDQELKEQFLIDKFTGLSTKSKLMDDIERTPKPSIYSNTLIYISIDSFDEINEYFGLDAGNKILSYVANWLKKELPTKEAKLYKLDLDNFAIFTTQRLSMPALNEYLKRISAHIGKENFYFEGTALNLSFTLGAARCKTDIVKCTYLALKDAQNLKKSYKIYNKSCQHDERFIKNIKMNQTIKDAISENRVVPFFQPIYNLKTDKIEKFESLIRIQTKDDGYLGPIEFLEIAKRSKLYLELSQSMIKSSFKKLEDSNFPITINLTAEDILDKKVSNFILRRLNSMGNGNFITFEIVESEKIDNQLKVSNFIKKVKNFGCKVAIDDFGSGYSNFEQILKLDVDFLKIDGSLIKNIDTNKDSEIMTKSIVSFAKEMGIQTIAEYVSNEAIFNKVKLLGIDYAQGYHIGKPTNHLGI